MDDKSMAETVQGTATAAREATDTGFERAWEYTKLGSDTAGWITETLSEFVRKAGALRRILCVFRLSRGRNCCQE